MPIEILMPALSPTMTSGNLTKWLVKEGDKVSPGEIIAEIETDKATMEVEAVDSGVIAKIMVDEGSENVPVNQIIALILEEDEDISSIGNYKNNQQKKPEIDDSAKHPEIIEYKYNLDKIESKSKRIFASPLAKKIAKDENIDLTNIDGTGPYGRIVRKDIIDDISNKNDIHVTQNKIITNTIQISNERKIPNSNMRKIIAKRLTESKQQIPHFYLTIECNLDELINIRAEINQSQNHYKLSINDFVIKASAKALKSVPAANAKWTDDSITIFDNIDISVAVAIEAGLITPIIKDAYSKSISFISNEMKDLANRAKLNKLAPNEFQGGSFSISNLGMFNIKNFNAIINPPQACILAVGAGIKKPIVKNDSISIATIMEVTLSVDHRAVDGSVGAEFLNEFRKYIENPLLLLV